MRNLIKKFTPQFLLSWYHFALAFLGAVFCRFPDKKLKVIGITGTKGKSTSVILAGKILEEEGFKVGWITSATLKIGEKEWLNPYHMTMPGRFFIQRFLREMVKSECQYALIEVTSEGVLQHRHRFIDFDAVAFTNLTPEHIEAHHGFENYRAAKGKLFKVAKNTHIVNLDDDNAEYFLKFPAQKKYGFGIKNGNKELGINRNKELEIIEAEEVKLGERYSSFIIRNLLFSVPLLGQFNVYNALSAITICLSQGIKLEVSKRALEKIRGIPGRLELIDEGQDFTVIVDLAHTPDSFEKIFNLVKNLSHNKIISVFGSAGGGRDKWKRPELGKIAAKYSNFIILCNEDSYSEEPAKIIDDIEKGVKEIGFEQQNCFKIEDRKEAIKKAIKLAGKDDIVLILGKGTEQIINIGNKKIPWDDRKVAREELK